MADIKKGFGLTDSEVKFIDDNFHTYEYQNKDIFEKCSGTRKKVPSKNKTKKNRKLN